MNNMESRGSATLRKRYVSSGNQRDNSNNKDNNYNTSNNNNDNNNNNVEPMNSTRAATFTSSWTDLPWEQENGQPAVESTRIPRNGGNDNNYDSIDKNNDDNFISNSSSGWNDNDNDNHGTGTPAGEPNQEDRKNTATTLTKTATATEAATTTTTTTEAATTSKQPRLTSPSKPTSMDGKSSSSGSSNNNNDNNKNDNSNIVKQQQERVSKSERKKGKIIVRIVSSCLMMSGFLFLLYMGHIYICALVAIVELLLFKELVKVRYHVYFDTIQDTIPLFRTTQYMWFAVAIFYTYGDFILEVVQNNHRLHYLLTTSVGFFGNLVPGMQYSLPSIAFCLYSGAFILTIATLQVGHIKFQLNQLCWTIVVLCLTVGQLKYIMHNVYNGLIWFVLPLMLVITNDIMAYVCGMTCGRKFIRRPFLSLSPNKTWEGFIGAWIFTMIISWYISRFLLQFTWMTCPTNEFNFIPPSSLKCDLHPLFQSAQSILPSQIFELLPRWIVKSIPNVIEVCSIKKDSLLTSTMTMTMTTTTTTTAASTTTATAELTRCISGEPNHIHHHFEFIIKDVYPMQIHALWLAIFASLVAPFGGFLASAIKRAYGIKDFDSTIPGHGGLMDRFDCQLIMALCTWVHYNSFVKLATISVPKLVYMYSLLSENEKIQFLNHLSNNMHDSNNIMHHHRHHPAGFDITNWE